MRQGRQLYWPPFSPLMKKLIIATIVCFIIQRLDPMVFDGKFSSYLSLSPHMVAHKFAFWQLFTYMFLHGGILHIIVNMLMLWMFGAELEGAWGTKKFLKFYFMAGIFSGIVSAASYYTTNNPIVGASGAIYALLIAYGFMFPDRQLLFFGIFPMKTKYFILLICVMTFYVAMGESTGNVAHFAHLGGIAFGLIYMKFGQWFGIFGQYKQYKKQAKRDKMKSRFKVISSEMDDEVDDFWKKHDDGNPDNWN